MRILIALTLANGARIRPVCRTADCIWSGQAWRTRQYAEIERNRHRRSHLKEASH
jgi:hypothetical protein